MALNPFFQKSNANEQTLVNDLVVETIKIHGHEVVYLFRESPEIDNIFGEDSLPSIYKIGKPIEMFIESVDGFEGEGDFISKFGLEIRDSMKLVVSKTRWKQEFAGISGGTGPETNADRPREGDLIFFPLSKGIFEIKFVEHENPFYQFGKNYVYKISCELATHAGDTYETNNTEIDAAGAGDGTFAEFAIDITLSTGGTGQYIVGESIAQGTSTARVVKWTPSIGANLAILRIERLSGIFSASQTRLIGADSGASWAFSTQVVTDISVGPPSETTTQNSEFDLEMSKIVDFTETNPFSEGN